MALSRRPVLVVGAGFAGAVYARTLADAGVPVIVIDKRSHIGGNCHDQVHASGIRYHTYGPHLFHTSNHKVMHWIARFGSFVPYAHSVTVELENGSHVPLPINIDTLNAVFDQTIKTKEQAAAFVESLAQPIISERNAADYLNSKFGETLTNIFFRPYTKKMWARDLEDLDASVVKRIPIRLSKEVGYFPDDLFQVLPERGYTALFENILGHELITVHCSTAFNMSILKQHKDVFNSMPVDEFYEYRFGPLPYRSIRFHHSVVPATQDTGPTSVVNFSDDRKYTRRTDWSKFPSHRVFETNEKLVTLEEPCDYTENNFERYYPVRASDDKVANVLKLYQSAALKEESIQFIGRCGTYQYLDMHQVINQSLQGAQKWLLANQ